MIKLLDAVGQVGQQVGAGEGAEPQVAVHQHVLVVFLVAVAVSVDHHLIAIVIEDIDHFDDPLDGGLAAGSGAIAPVVLQVDDQGQVQRPAVNN